MAYNPIDTGIPASFRKPLAYASFNLSLANKGLGANRLTGVVVAPKLAIGTQPAGIPIDVYSDTDAATYAGLGSVAAEMVNHALRTNPNMPLSLVLVDDPAGAQATWTVTYAGTPTKAASEKIYVGDVMLEVATSLTDTPTTIAAAIAAAVNSKPNLTASATSAAGVVTVKFKHKGALGNLLKLNVAGSTAGVTRTLVANNDGTLAHDVTAALAGIYTAGHKLMVSAWSDTTTLTAMLNHADTVSNGVEMRGLRCWYGSNGSTGAANSISNALNGWLMHQAYVRYTQTLGATAAPWAIAAAVAARDSGEEDPAMPLNTLTLPTLPVPDKVDVLSRQEQEALLNTGVTPLEPGPGNLVQIVRAITTYTTSAAGAPDPALLDITTPKTLMYFREQVVNDQKIRFGRGKFSTRRANAIKQRAYEIAKMLEDLEILQNVDDYKDQFRWVADLQNANRMNLQIPSPIVPGLHIIASVFNLYIESPHP